MIARMKSIARVVSELFNLLVTVAIFLGIVSALVYASALVLERGITDYGLLAGILIATPFVAVIWIAGVMFGAWLRTAK